MRDLRWDIERAVFNSTMDSRARLIMLALLAKADNATAVTAPEHTPAFSTLAAMTGLSKAVLSEWLQALEDSGWVIRSKPDGGGRGNRTIYAMREGAPSVVRRPRDLRVPRPRKNSSPGEPFEAKKVRPANASETGNGSPGERFTEEKGFAQRTPNSSPSEPFSAEKGSPGERATTNPPPTGEGDTKNHQPARGAGGVVNSSTARSAKWATGDHQPRTAGAGIPEQPLATPAAVAGRTAPLFKIPSEREIARMLDAHKVIYHWCTSNGFDTFTADDIAAVHRKLIGRFGNQLNQRYLVGILGGSGIFKEAQEVLEARNKVIGEMLQKLQAESPMCGHGTPAGHLPHPGSGVLICVECRLGVPADEIEVATDPRAVAALAAFRAARTGRTQSTEIIGVTQQIEAWLAGGADEATVGYLATEAGRTHKSFHEIAMQGAAR